MENKNLRLTGVWQDCEFCSKYTFISRKNFIFDRNKSVPKFATSPSAGTLGVILKRHPTINKQNK